MITLENFIKQCANSIRDVNFIVISQDEWKEVLNIQISDLYPEIAIVTVSDIASTNIDNSVNELDLSDDDSFPNIIGVKSIYEVDSSSNKIKLNNWTFDNDLNIVFLESAIPTGYSAKVTWTGEMQEKDSFSDTINLPASKLSLLRKACLKEVLNRILMDKTKFDRYKTLTGQVNEYVILAIQKNLQAEIEISKRKITNTSVVRTIKGI